MDKLIEILEDIKPGVDYETCDTLIDDGLLDSFAILSIVSELQDEFDIAITPACLLYTSDAADEEDSVDLGGRRIIKKKIFSSIRRQTR